ncbi:phosphonate ABC transporter substrate-binding protein [Vibrio sp. 10N.261.55.A7]|uniref:phosphonate ABC transporter substrate-binding protein n=1 Tax=Vibrio sp. 10N.261.55.A7 TaxID=1880851 RepID=UPI000C855E9D|nr:phosphonate ABC transporter substrate-binding protein [Vibrio sp. 10N.261.55.A7]PMK05226.1 phosphonate ABC transporter substrate-binding protein [Vibrio sp. 10N.261.55.A7]
MKKLLSVGIAMASAATFNVNAAAPSEINLGILGGQNAADQIGDNQCVADFLKAELGVKTNIRNSTDYNAVIQGLLGEKIDLVVNMSPKSYAEVYLNDPKAVDLVGITVDNTDNSRGYHSVILVKEDSEYQSIDDLKNTVFSFADPNSTSGYLIPNNQLEMKLGGNMDNKYNDFFESVNFSGGHEQDIVGVLNGQFDAAVTWSSMVGEKDKGYSAGALTRFMDHEPELMNKVRIIWESPLIANGPTIVSNRLDPKFKDDLVVAVKKLAREENACFSKAAGGSLHLEETSVAEYQSIIDLVKATKFAQR